jgi:hypothetical protein
LPRRPEAKVILVAIVGLVLGAVVLGSSDFSAFVRVFGGLMVVGAVKNWCEYWQARDRYAAWQKRYRR